MSDFSIEKKRVYVLIGHNGEKYHQAQKRLQRVYDMGFLPFAMLYRGDDAKPYPVYWRMLARRWSRPAIYRSKSGSKVIY
jgi:hypothetical protein